MVCKIRRTLPCIGLLLVLLGAPAQAATNPQCQVIEPKRQKLNADIATKIAPLSQLRIKNSYDFSQAAAVYKTKLVSIQKDGDAKRLGIFKKLSAKAKTNDQKAAMKVYSQEFTAALTALRISQNQNNDNYITSFNNLVAAHRSAVDTQLDVLKKKFEAALNNAYAQCLKVGIDKASLQLKSDIVLAQTTFIAAPNVSPQSVQTALQATTDNYKTAQTAAVTAFNQSTILSGAKLKPAFANVKYIFD